MYLGHFSFRVRPFRSTPDVDSYYPSTTHESTLERTRQAIQDEEGLVLVHGNPGSGKTLLAYRLMDGIGKSKRTVLLTNSHFRQPADLLQNILFDLGLPYQQLSEQELRLSLTENCLDHFRKNESTVIVMDEAHLLNDENLEELRLLSNLEGKEGKAVQIALFGLPSLVKTIQRPELSILRQRLALCSELVPLTVDESADYLLHQIRWAGGQPEKVLGEDVLDILSHASGGNPRMLNRAAHCAFTLAFQAGSTTVDAEAAVEAVTRLGLDERANEESERQPKAEFSPPAPTSAEDSRDTSTIPMVPPAPVSVQLPRDEGPPTYVYGGVEPRSQRRAG